MSLAALCAPAMPLVVRQFIYFKNIIIAHISIVQIWCGNIYCSIKYKDITAVNGSVHPDSVKITLPLTRYSFFRLKPNARPTSKSNVYVEIIGRQWRHKYKLNIHGYKSKIEYNVIVAVRARAGNGIAWLMRGKALILNRPMRGSGIRIHFQFPYWYTVISD